MPQVQQKKKKRKKEKKKRKGKKRKEKKRKEKKRKEKELVNNMTRLISIFESSCRFQVLSSAHAFQEFYQQPDRGNNMLIKSEKDSKL